VFLTGPGVDLVRRGAIDHTTVSPLDPLRDLVNDFLKRGGTLWACTPCVKSRGYTQDHLIEGTIISGASPMHELIKNGAATLSF
jgi:predicted peroxiredoxin